MNPRSALITLLLVSGSVIGSTSLLFALCNNRELKITLDQEPLYVGPVQQLSNFYFPCMSLFSLGVGAAGVVIHGYLGARKQLRSEEAQIQQLQTLIQQREQELGTLASEALTTEPPLAPQQPHWPQPVAPRTAPTSPGFAVATEMAWHAQPVLISAMLPAQPAPGYALVNAYNAPPTVNPTVSAVAPVAVAPAAPAADRSQERQLAIANP